MGMKKALLFLGLSLYASLGYAQNEQRLVFNFASPRQTIHSFGASDCWRVQYIGKNWPIEKRNQIADLLFSSELDSWGNPKGIGLSMWRFNIGSGSHEAGDNGGVASLWRRAECFLDKEGDWDWDKQEGQRWMLQAARERGVRYSLGFSITAPYFMTKNGMARASEKTPYANIREDQFDDYAAFLAEVSTHLGLDYLSPINEPQWERIGKPEDVRRRACQIEQVADQKRADDPERARVGLDVLAAASVIHVKGLVLLHRPALRLIVLSLSFLSKTDVTLGFVRMTVANWMSSSSTLGITETAM